MFGRSLSECPKATPVPRPTKLSDKLFNPPRRDEPARFPKETEPDLFWRYATSLPQTFTTVSGDDFQFRGMASLAAVIEWKTQLVADAFA